MSNDSKQSQGSRSRVYKSTQVHRRRADRKSRPGSRGASVASAIEGQAAASGPAFGEAVDATVEGVPELSAPDPVVSAHADDVAGQASRDAQAGQRTAAISPVDVPSVVADATVADEVPTGGAAVALPPVASDPLAPDLGPLPAAADIAESDDGRPTLMDHEEFSNFFSAPDDAVESFKAETRKADAKRRTMAIVIAAIVAVLVVALVAGLAWNRWGRYDDQADMQGEWYVVGTEVPVVIDEATIKLTDDVSYTYTVDQNEKTISYQFGKLEGQGRYWFSDDRNYLVITDGDNYTGANTAAEDLVKAFTDLTAAGTTAAKLPEGDGIIAFSRTPEKAATASSASAASSSSSASAPAAPAVTLPSTTVADELVSAGTSVAKAAGADDQAARDDQADEEASAEDYYYDPVYDESEYADYAVDDEPESGDDAVYDDGLYDESYDDDAAAYDGSADYSDAEGAGEYAEADYEE